MSPEPYVRGQAAVLAVLLVAAAVLASPIAILVLSVVSAAMVVGLSRKYRRDVRTARSETPAHRRRLDDIVAGDARAAIGAGIVASGLLYGFGVRVVDIGAAPATPVLVAGAAAAVYLSSLVDWYVILPRISGQLGVRPCRSDDRLPGFPHTWRLTTQWWYVHRIAAALLLRFGLAFAITLTVHRYVSLFGGSSVVVAAALGFLASYLAAVPKAAFEAGHPTLIVGRTVQRTEGRRRRRKQLRVARRTISIPALTFAPIGNYGRRQYVYDIALEGVQLVPARPRERAVPRDDDGTVSFEKDPEKVLLKNLGAVRPGEPAFQGCRETCSGINWYCIENPRCYEPK